MLYLLRPRLPGDRAHPLLHPLSHNQNSCKPGQKDNFTLVFQHAPPLFKNIFTTANTCRTASWIRLLNVVYNSSKPPTTHQFTLRWCFQSEALATVNQEKSVLPLNKLQKAVDGVKGLFVFFSTRENFFVVVLNTEICTCLPFFLWGAVFLK